MRIHITHHTYNIAMTKKIVGFFLLRKFSSGAPNIVGTEPALKDDLRTKEAAVAWVRGRGEKTNKNSRRSVEGTVVHAPAQS